jgi:hypothetical protein
MFGLEVLDELFLQVVSFVDTYCLQKHMCDVSLS